MDYQHRESLPTAFRLLVDCCKRSFTPVARRLATEPSEEEWTTFLRLSRRHRVQGLAWRGLRSGQLEPPAPIRDQLQADAQDIAAAGLALADQAARLHQDMAGARIDHVFVKGLTLSALAYGDAFLKMSSDVDVLVSPEAIGAAAALLDDRGFRMIEPAGGKVVEWHASRKESVWLGRDGTIVELHSRLADNRRLIPAIGMGSSRQSVPIGAGIALPTLTDDQLLIYLAVHGASSAWFRLKWVADFAALADQRTADELKELARRAETEGAGRTFAQALLLAATLFRIDLGNKLHAAVGTRTNRTFVRMALGELLQEREPLDRRLGTAGIHAAQLLAAPGAGFALSEITRQTMDYLKRR